MDHPSPPSVVLHSKQDVFGEVGPSAPTFEEPVGGSSTRRTLSMSEELVGTSSCSRTLRIGPADSVSQYETLSLGSCEGSNWRSCPHTGVPRGTSSTVVSPVVRHVGHVSDPFASYDFETPSSHNLVWSPVRKAFVASKKTWRERLSWGRTKPRRYPAVGDCNKPLLNCSWPNDRVNKAQFDVNVSMNEESFDSQPFMEGAMSSTLSWTQKLDPLAVAGTAIDYETENMSLPIDVVHVTMHDSAIAAIGCSGKRYTAAVSDPTDIRYSSVRILPHGDTIKYWAPVSRIEKPRFYARDFACAFGVEHLGLEYDSADDKAKLLALRRTYAEAERMEVYWMAEWIEGTITMCQKRRKLRLIAHDLNLQVQRIDAGLQVFATDVGCITDCWNARSFTFQGGLSEKDDAKAEQKLSPKTRAALRAERDRYQQECAARLAKVAMPKREREIKIKKLRDKRNGVWPSWQGPAGAVAGVCSVYLFNKLRKVLTQVEKTAQKADKAMDAFERPMSALTDAFGGFKKHIQDNMLLVLPLVLCVHWTLKAMSVKKTVKEAVVAAMKLSIPEPKGMQYQGPMEFDDATVVNFFSKVWTAMVNLGDDAPTMSAKLMNALSAIHRKGDKLEDFMDFVFDLFENAARWAVQIFGHDPDKLWKRRKTRYKTWCKRVNELQSQEVSYTELPIDFVDEVQDLLKEGFEIRNLMMGTRAYAEMGKLLAELDRLYAPIRSTITARQNYRVEPLFMLLTGAPGIGKTLFTTRLAATIMLKSGTVKPDKVMSQIWARPPGKFWSSYAQQFTMVVDDFGQTRVTTAIEESEYTDIIRMISSFAMPLNMADLASKGKTFFNSKLVVGTTNGGSMSAEIGKVLNTPEAFYRRIGYGLHVKLLDQYMKPGTSFLDYAQWNSWCENHSKEDEVLDRVPWHFWEAQTWDYDKGIPMGPFRPFRAFIEEASKDLYNRLSNHDVQFKQLSELCKESENLNSFEFQGASDIASTSRSGSRVVPANWDEIEIDCAEEQWATKPPRVLFDHPIKPRFGSRPGNIMKRVWRRFASWLKDEPHPKTIEGGDSELPATMLLDRDLRWREIYTFPVTRDGKLKPGAPQMYLHSDFHPNLVALTGLYDHCVDVNIDAWWVEMCETLECYMDHDAATAAISQWFALVGHAMHFAKFGGVIHGVALRAHDLEFMFRPEATSLLTLVMTASLFIGLVVMFKALISALCKAIKGLFCMFASPFMAKRGDKGNFQDGDYETYLDQATIMNTDEKIVNKCLTHLVSLEVNGVHFGSLTGVTNTYYLMPKHFLAQIRKRLEDGRLCDKDVVRLSWLHTSIVHNITVEEFLAFKCVTISGKDISMVDLGSVRRARVPTITHFFVSRNNVRYLEGKKLVLNVLRKHNDSTILHTMQALKPRVCKEVAVADTILQDIVSYASIHTPTKHGDCGGLLLNPVDNRMSSKKVVGFHVAGKGNVGLTQVVTCEEIETLATELGSLGQLELPIDIEEDLIFQGPFCDQIERSEAIYVGKLNKSLAVNSKSNYVKTPIYKEVYEQFPIDKKYPAILKPTKRNGTLVNPMLGACWRYMKSYERVKPTISLELATRIAMQPFTDLSADHSRVILTFEEAVAGISEWGFKGITRGTSAGYPYEMDTPGFKRLAFGEEEYTLNTPLALSLKADVQDFLGKCSSGIVPSVLYKDFLKDELRSVAKIEAVSTRMISSAPVHYTIAVRQYFGAFMAAFFNCKVNSGMAPGIVCYSEWGKLAEFIGERKVLDGDLMDFDATQIGEVHYSILDYINQWYRMGPEDEGSEAERIRCTLWESLTNSMHIGGDGFTMEFLYILCGCMPSGHPLTTPVNSIYSLIAIVYSYIRSTGKEDFWDRVRPQTYGDDNLIAVDADTELLLPPEALVEGFKELGLVLTSSDKVSSLAYKPLSECTFLKRGFKKEEGKWLCPLNLTSIFTRLAWTKRNENSVEIMVENLEEVLHELSLHPKEMWDDFAPKVVEFMRLYDVHPRLGGGRYADFVKYRAETLSRSEVEW